MSPPPCFYPRSRVSALLIVAKDRRTKCIVLTVADTERARPREDGTEKWPCFCVLRRFAVNFKSHHRQWNANGAKPRKTQKRGKAKGCGQHRLPHFYTVNLTLSDCVGNNSRWALSCFTSRSLSPSILPAQNSVFKIRTVMCDRGRKIASRPEVTASFQR